VNERNPGQPLVTGLDLAGRRAVVLGDGKSVLRQLGILQMAGADIVIVAAEASPMVEALAASGRAQWIPRAWTPEDLDGAWYAAACADDPRENAAIAAAAEKRRVFCFRSDPSSLGSAVEPEPVTEAIVDGVSRTPPGVALIGAGPGDPELITVRGMRLLRAADVVVVDRLAPLTLLAEVGSQVEIIDAAKIPYGRAAAQDDLNAVMIERALTGKFVARLKGGDPYLFGRGFEELIECVKAGVPVTVVPGVTSALAVPALAGVPATHRGLAHDLTVVSGHLSPGHPESSIDWQALGHLRGTLVVLMGVAHIREIAAALAASGRDVSTPAVIVQDGTTPSQRAFASTLSQLADDTRRHGIRPPAVFVIGEVAGLINHPAFRSSVR
jgi:uroporphyrin-III C-methyltransferase / precorrin-2 dehydrogenase / sirohydrochlorin ferrochelatase